MDKTISFLRILFHILSLLLIIISLYPGNILGLLFYGDINFQPQIFKNFLFISSNHFCIYFLISLIGLFSYTRGKRLKTVIIYLFFLSIILETLHFVIPQRTFEVMDVTGNILGVLTACIVVLIYKFCRR